MDKSSCQSINNLSLKKIILHKSISGDVLNCFNSSNHGTKHRFISTRFAGQDGGHWRAPNGRRFWEDRHIEAFAQRVSDRDPNKFRHPEAYRFSGK